MVRSRACAVSESAGVGDIEMESSGPAVLRLVPSELRIAATRSTRPSPRGAWPPHRRLDRLQIQTPGLVPATENDAQELIYFARDFLADRFRGFFSWAAGGSSSIGRRRQISLLASTNSRLSCWYLRNSVTSRSAFRIADGEGNDSVTDLPFTL